MNEYQKEFIKIFSYLKVTMNDYVEELLLKNNISNPFSKKKYQEYIEQLKVVKNDKEYIKLINDLLISIHSGHVYLTSKATEIDNDIIPLIIQYYQKEYYITFALDKKLIGKKITKINNELIDSYIAKLNNSSYFDNNKLYLKQFIPKNEGTITLTIDNHENIEINPVFKNIFFKEYLNTFKTHRNNISFELKDNIPYLKINSFNDNLVNDKEKYILFDRVIYGSLNYLKAIAEYINNNNYEDLIIDIRENSGGSDKFFLYLGLFSDKNYIDSLKLKSNIGKIDISELNSFISKEPENIDDSIQRLKSQDNTFYEIQKFIPDCNSTIKRRYLLIGDRNYSTADALAKLAKRTGFATLIGTKTSGDGEGITPYCFTSPILKQNDISVVIPSTFGNLKEFNTYPDIFIEEDLINKYELNTSNDYQLKKIIEEVNKRAISNDYTLN